MHAANRLFPILYAFNFLMNVPIRTMTCRWVFTIKTKSYLHFYQISKDVSASRR